jgi:hypothetical protein
VGLFYFTGLRTPVPPKKRSWRLLNICSVCGIILPMPVDYIIIGLILTNTIVILLNLTVIVSSLVKMNENAKFTDVECSLGELSKIIEQQSRLLEFISRRGGG